MNDVELIAKAREHLKSILNLHSLPGMQAEMFTEGRIAHVPMVSFGCKDRENVIEIILDPHSGDCLSVTHVPKQPKRTGG